MKAIASDQGPEKTLVALGYAGWSPGQIESELSQNTWLTVPASQEIIFNLASEEKFTAAMQSLGIRDANLSHEVGHA